MSTTEIAQRLVELCRNGQYADAYAELFAPDFKSIEPVHAAMPAVVGVEGIQRRAALFHETIKEVHSGYFNDPQIAGRFFSMALGFEATYTDGTRRNFDEIGVYEVKDGKIVKEQFFF
ncbi:MAG: nuclear transport factor 2 family protein [Bacteroidetes bacterium]|nr:MAG: nuclear transport factor 2 family protein [Bacteroidota bacterium]